MGYHSFRRCCLQPWRALADHLDFAAIVHCRKVGGVSREQLTIAIANWGIRFFAGLGVGLISAMVPM